MTAVKFEIVQGPFKTDFNGNLKAPIEVCTDGTRRCHCLGINDWHYPYCAGQHNPGNDGGRLATYPWFGAGTHIHRERPNDGCPYKNLQDYVG